MEKRGKSRVLVFVLLIIAVAAVAAIIFELQITGRVVDDGVGVEVIRLIVKNETVNLTNIKIGIISTENIIAIREAFSSEDCGVVDYLVEPGIDVFEFNEQEVIWVLANKSDNLIIFCDSCHMLQWITSVELDNLTGFLIF